MLALAAAGSARATVDVSQPGAEPISLTSYLEVLEDSTRALTLDAVRSPKVASRFKGGFAPAYAIELGFTQAAHWLRFTLRNEGEHSVALVVDLSWSRFSTLEFHAPAGQGYEHTLTGLARPFATRARPNRFFVFPITLPPHSEQTFYLRATSNTALYLPLRAWGSEAFRLHERTDYALQALYFGIVLAMLFYNLCLFISLRDSLYLFYVAFVASTALAVAEQNGLSTEFLWPNAPGWTVSGYGISLCAFGVSTLLFVRRMLGTRQLAPRLDRMMVVAAVLYGLAPMALLMSYETAVRPFIALHLVTEFVILFATLHALFRSQRDAVFFFVAYIAFFVGTFSNTAKNFGWISLNFASNNGWQWGSAVGMLVLAFALADRYHQLRRHAAQAQNEALSVKQQLVETLQSSERELEIRVAKRTEELHEANHRLEALSTTDSLTGIANRRSFDSTLAMQWAGAQRAGVSMTLGMVDVDWFKKYNDRYGHQAGDVCLRKVADVLASTFSRQGDLVARYGGEEFTFTLLGINGANALKLAERVCQAMHDLDVAHEGSPLGRVTISVGIATLSPDRYGATEDLIRAADEALYRAKAQGRNQALAAS